jgi:hypothetical protein
MIATDVIKGIATDVSTETGDSPTGVKEIVVESGTELHVSLNPRICRTTWENGRKLI